MTTTPDLDLADFPVAGVDEWRALVDKVLKGADFERTLVSTTYDGIAIQPLYTAADRPTPLEQFPGQPDFARGSNAAGPPHGAWEIRQTQQHPDPVEANRRVLEDLDGGVNSLALRLDIGGAGLVDGVVIGGLDDLVSLLDGVYLDLVSIVLEAGVHFGPSADLLIQVWDRNEVAPDERRGNLGADPLGALASSGRLSGSVEVALGRMADLAALTAPWPHVRAVHVDTAAYVDAGASEAEELAIMLATGVEYLGALLAAGQPISVAADQIGFTLSADADVFATVAKLRAARRLWAHALAAAGAADAASAPIAVRTATRMMTVRDPWVNMLRTTAACFAAGVGGATTVTVQPFDTAIGRPDDLARRLARNTQLVLQEESHVGLVTDPAGGSFFIEQLTDDLVARAWERFVQIQAAGGLSASLMDGSIASALAAITSARMSNIAKRKDPLTGVSEFPNLSERVLVRPAPDVAALRAAAVARWSGPDLATGSDSVIVEPLPAVRLSVGFEALRDAGDEVMAATGQRPRVFLANLGPVSVHTARASFAKNFFEAGGIEAVGIDGYNDDAELTTAFAASGARLAVICSSDGIYADRAAATAAALRDAGATRVYLAGNPGEQRQSFTAAGVDEFVHVGVDVLATLRTAYESLGVAR